MSADYDNATPYINKMVNKDGSITTFEGRNAESQDEQYNQAQPLANKVLNPDGSITELF